MITPPTNHYSSPHNSPPGFNGSMNNRRNLFPRLLLENKINDNSELDKMYKTYIFIQDYLAGNLHIPDKSISGLKFLIDTFPKHNFSIDQYNVICNIINKLLVSPSYGNVLNMIDSNMSNNNLDGLTKTLLNVISDNLNDFLPILLPKLFLNLYNNPEKGFNIWGIPNGFNTSINNIDPPISKNLFNNIPNDIIMSP
jgi:hypothetical protein